MKLSAHSRNQLLNTFARWEVPRDFADPMFNYLVYGYQPGSFFTAVLANNFAKAILSSHPANTVEALKSMVGWMRDNLPEETWGSYVKVDAWCDMPAVMRRPILEEHKLVFTEEDEMMLTLQGQPTQEPILY